MNKSLIGAGIVVIAAIIVGVFVVISGDDQPVVGETPLQEFTLSEVSQHNTESDCWTVIDGAVYDLSSFIAQHPGGDEIVRACGIDGSSLFNSRTTSDGETVGSGMSHSSSANSQLANLQIGTLVD